MNNQEIIDNAPEGTTHIDCEGYLDADNNSYWNITKGKWYAMCELTLEGDIQSLADIKRIVELETQQARAEILIHELHEQVYDNRYLDNRVRLYEVLKEQYDE
jgi:hypothetical protein